MQHAPCATQFVVAHAPPLVHTPAHALCTTLVQKPPPSQQAPGGGHVFGVHVPAAPHTDGLTHPACVETTQVPVVPQHAPAAPTPISRDVTPIWPPATATPCADHDPEYENCVNVCADTLLSENSSVRAVTLEIV